MEESAFEEGPVLVEEGQFYDPEYVVVEENPPIDISEIDGWQQLVINPEVIPLIAESFTVDVQDIDQSIKIADYEAVIYAS